MSKRVDGRRITKFQQDRNVLPYTDAQIAVLMGINKSSYSSYINGRYPVTHTFLQKFYAAFEEELQQLRKDNLVREENPAYNDLKLEDRIKDLESKLDHLMESHQHISTDIDRLEKKLEDLLNTKFETLLARLRPPRQKKAQKKPGG